MKTEIIEIEETKKFKPFTIQITVENEKEAVAFYVLFNSCRELKGQPHFNDIEKIITENKINVRSGIYGNIYAKGVFSLFDAL